MSNTFPVVNMNGDRAETLIAQAQKVSEALREAKAAIQEAFPHGRNFQNNPAGDYDKAREEAYAMLAALDTLSQYYYRLTDNVCDQKAARTRRA